MSNLQPNEYNKSSFLPPEGTSNPMPQAYSSYTGTRHGSADRNHHTQASRFDAGQGSAGERSGYLRGEYTRSQANPNTSAYCQATPHQSPSSPLSVQPPLNCPVAYPAPHDTYAAQAFTETSPYPSVAHRMVLNDVLHSPWIHNQDAEPCMIDVYSRDLHRRVAHLSDCPAFDFSSSKTSVLNVFVGNAGGHHWCLICDKPKDSVPRVLSCIRSHLRLKPFRCKGCESCNQKNRHATFGSAALLRDHVSGQKTVPCTECGKELRRGNLRRHQATIHKDVEDLIEFLMDDEESD